jgi:hypothetical protein
MHKPRMRRASAPDRKQKHQVGAIPVGARLPAICRAAVAKSGDPILPDTPHAPVLLPVPGRSRDKPRSYNEKWNSGDGCTNQKAKSVSSRPKPETSGGLGPCRSVACPAICRAAVAKPDDSILPDTSHAQVLLPVPGRSSGCGPDTSHVPTIWSGVWTLDQSQSRQTARIRDRRNLRLRPQMGARPAARDQTKKPPFGGFYFQLNHYC